MVRKYITPGSVRIYGLPGTDDNFGLRDNGAGQMWSESKRVGSINYWTGEVVLAKEYVPKVRFWNELRVLLGLESPAPKVRYKYEVSDLNIETRTEPRTTASGFSLVLTEDYRRR
jgi:hypothetical protein